MRILKRYLLPLLLLAAPSALAQSQPAQVTRVVVLPFDASASVSAYQIGLSTALVRALNEVPNIFAPAVGDAALVVQHATDAGADALQTVGSLFSADVIVSGSVSGSDQRVSAKLVLHRSSGDSTVTADAGTGSPAELARSAAAALVKALVPDVGAQTLSRVDDAAAQTPSLPSLGPVARAASRLPGVRAGDLATAAQLDGDSSWVQAEYARVLALGGDTTQGVKVAQQAVEAQPDDVEAQVVLGIVLSADGQQDAARAAFQKALDINPAQAVALTGIASVTADPAEAVADLEAAIDAYPRMVDAYIQLAALQNTPQKGLQALRRGEKALPESIPLRRAVLRRVLAAGDAKGALAYLQQAVQEPLAPTAGLYALARDLPPSVADGALALVREGEKAYPDDTSLKVAEADLLLRSGDYQGAQTILAPLHDSQASNAEIANLLAVAQARQGDVQGAQKTFESVMGTNDTARRALGKLYLAAGRAQSALDTLEPLVGQDSKDAQAITYYGIALSRIGKLDEAKTALKRALDLQPGLALADRAMSLIDQQANVTGGQTVTFNEKAGTAFQQGLYALEVQDYASAAEAFARSRAAGDTPLAAFYQGYALQLTGDARGALADYQVALKAFPDSDIVLNNVGYGHLQVGRYDLALDELGRAVDANPDNAQAHLNLGLTYYALGRYKDAVGAFDAAVAIDASLKDKIQQVYDAAQQKANP